MAAKAARDRALCELIAAQGVITQVAVKADGRLSQWSAHTLGQYWRGEGRQGGGLRATTEGLAAEAAWAKVEAERDKALCHLVATNGEIAKAAVAQYPALSRWSAAALGK